MPSAASTPRVVVLSLRDQYDIKQTHARLLAKLQEKATMEFIEGDADLLRRVRSSLERAPTAVLMTDAALTLAEVPDEGELLPSDSCEVLEQFPRIWEVVLEYVRRGGTAIAMGNFSCSVRPNDIQPFFSRADLNWSVGAYHRTEVVRKADAAAISGLPERYSQKAQFLKGVEPASVWYGPDLSSVTQSAVFASRPVLDLSQAAAALAQVDIGKLGYVGDVNAEESTDVVILALCGL